MNRALRYWIGGLLVCQWGRANQNVTLEKTMSNVRPYYRDMARAAFINVDQVNIFSPDAAYKLKQLTELRYVVVLFSDGSVLHDETARNIFRRAQDEFYGHVHFVSVLPPLDHLPNRLIYLAGSVGNHIQETQNLFLDTAQTFFVGNLEMLPLSTIKAFEFTVSSQSSDRSNRSEIQKVLRDLTPFHKLSNSYVLKEVLNFSSRERRRVIHLLHPDRLPRDLTEPSRQLALEIVRSVTALKTIQRQSLGCKERLSAFLQSELN